MNIYIGFDPREASAFAVAKQSALDNMSVRLPVRGVVLDKLRQQGLYWRPTETRLGRLYDVISEHEMSTEFAISRFLVPHICGAGWALFTDCDVLFRDNPKRIFEGLDGRKAVYCVKHKYEPPDKEKMDGQVQSKYARKNWSSVMVFNCNHPANKKLTVEMVNTLPGRDLHRFCWLKDSQIGELDPAWNWLPGHSTGEPKIVHFTEGGPWFPAFQNVPYADEWRAKLTRWAA